MFIQVILAILGGVFLGIITGLTPGIHINLISLIILSISGFFLKFISPIIVCVVIVSMSVTHTFLDFIPSVFLGAPDADTALSILPGHKLLLEGKAFEAVKLTVIGSLGALIFSVAIIPILIPVVGFVYPFLKRYIAYILIFVVVYMILRDKNKKWNLFVFLLSGVLGLIVLGINGLNNPLFPMLSGLFGLSMLVTSLADHVNIPEQKIEETIELDKKEIVKSLFAGTIAGTLTSFFPGLGPAQGAVVANQLFKNISDFGFMIIVGGINTVNFVLSLVTLLVLNKARNGAIIVVSQIMNVVSLNDLLIFSSVALLVGGIATFLAFRITRIFSKIMSKVNYKLLVISIIVMIVGMTFYFSGFLGLLILVTSTAIGIIPGELGVARNHAMGCLLLPVIIYLL